MPDQSKEAVPSTESIPTTSNASRSGESDIDETKDEKENVKSTESNNDQKTEDLTELDRLLLVEPPLSPISPLMMDTTGHNHISAMANSKYSTEILEDLNDVVDLRTLRELKGSDPKEYLVEVKKPVHALWQSVQSLTTHTQMFVVRILIVLGTLLNYAEEAAGSKSRYILWLKGNFGSEQMRLFQQAKQLANMGGFAKTWASIGKNRLLEFDRLRSILDKTLVQILADHPFQDTTEDMEGQLFKEHIDAIITYHRLTTGGIPYAIFEQASIIAAYKHTSLKVREVKKIKEWLDPYENQEYFFDIIVMNILGLPELQPEHKNVPPSVNKILSDVVTLREKVESIEEDALSDYAIDESIIRNAHVSIMRIARKFGINLTDNDSLIPQDTASN